MTYMETLQAQSKEDLINDAFNERVRFWADYADNDPDEHAHREKRIPYIGWFWRSTDFVNKCISIGDCGEFIGVMENNKWDYASRWMTEQEVDTFIAYLEKAFAESDKNGGKTEESFAELWAWFQTLTV